MRYINRIRKKLLATGAVVILVVLLSLLVLDVSFRFLGPRPASGSELLVTVGNPAAGAVVDPSGSTIPAAGPYGTIIVPRLGPGEYQLVLRGDGEGENHFSIEALSGGESAFRYAGSYNATADGEFLVRLNVEVLDGLVQDIHVISNESVVSLAESTDSAGRRLEATTSTLETARSAITRRLNLAAKYVANQWIAVGSMVFLTLVLVAIWRKR